MVRLHADLEEIIEFNRILRSFDGTLQGEFASIEAAWNRVSGAWDDEVHRHFAEMFEEFRPYIRRYLEASSDYENFLSEKIAALGEYKG